MGMAEKHRRWLFSFIGGLLFAVVSCLGVLHEWETLASPAVVLAMGGIIGLVIGLVVFRLAWNLKNPNRTGFAIASLAAYGAMYVSLSSFVESGAISSAATLWTSIAFGGLFWLFVVWGASLLVWLVIGVARGKVAVRTDRESSHLYYIKHDDGPELFDGHTADEVRAAISDDMAVRRDDEDDWTPVQEHPDFRVLFKDDDFKGDR
jgi:xanthosine utilization system XapX-like protein